MTTERVEIVRTARLDRPEWVDLRCGISVQVRWHGESRTEVRLVFRIPKGIDAPEVLEAKGARA